MRWYALLALLAIVVMMVSSCASSGLPYTVSPTGSPSDAAPAAGGPASSVPTVEPAASTVTISFGAQKVERQVYEPLISAFNTQNPGIHVQFVAVDDAIEASDAASAGPTDMLRRIVNEADTAAFFVSAEGIKNKYLQDLKPFMDADASFDHADFYPNALELFRQGDGIYAMPRTLPIPLLSYNKDLWAARGLPTPKPDWSWNDLVASAEQIAQKQGNAAGTYGLIDQQGGVTALNAELASAGINIFTTPLDQLQLDRPEVAAALNHVAELIKSGAIYAQPQAGQGDTPGAAQRLILDQRAGIWPVAALFDGPADPTPAFAIGTLPFPNLALPLSDSPQAYFMSAGTQHPVESWRWLSFLSHQPTRLPYERPDQIDQLPARKSVAEQSGYWSKLDAQTSAAVTSALARPVLTADTFDNFAALPLGRALDSVLRGEKPADQALRSAQAALAQHIAQLQVAPSPTPDTAPILVATPVPNVAPADATTITFSTLGIGSDQTTRIAQEFNRSNAGVFVNVRNVDQSKRTPQLSDLADTSDCFDWSGPPAATDAGLLDLQPLFDSDSTFKLDDYPPALLAPFKRSGALYGLPYRVDFRVLAYNQTIFDRAGLAHPTADWTPDDFLNAAQHLTSGTGATKIYGFVAPDDQTRALLFFLRRFGASLVRQGGDAQQPNFTDPAVAQAIRFYLDLLRASSPHTRINGYRSGQQDNSFLLTEQGRAGMWFSFGLDPEVYRVPGFTVAIAPPPLGTGPASSDDVHVSGLYISARSQHPEACWTWLKYLSSAALGLDAGFPARRTVAESQAFVNQAPPGAIDVYRAYSAAFERTPAGAVQEPLDQSQIDLYWFFRAVDQALQGKNLEQELADAQALTEQYLACVRSGTAGAVCARQVDPGYQGTSQAAPASR